MRFRPAILGALLACAAFAGLSAHPRTEQVAWARTGFDSAYGFSKTWNAALRLLRVDEHFTVTEKDEAGGYMLFQYTSPEGGKSGTPGSIEIVRGASEASPVKVLIQLPQMPGFHEQVLANALQKKLRAEFGAPSEPAGAPSKDAGADAN